MRLEFKSGFCDLAKLYNTEFAEVLLIDAKRWFWYFLSFDSCGYSHFISIYLRSLQWAQGKLDLFTYSSMQIVTEFHSVVGKFIPMLSVLTSDNFTLLIILITNKLDQKYSHRMNGISKFSMKNQTKVYSFPNEAINKWVEWENWG